MKRNSIAVWRGDGLTGQGTLTSQSGVLQDQPYSFKTRFESQDGKAGTNPEELIAAAHAGCFSMALAFMLAAAGLKADELRTTALVDIQQQGEGFAIVSIELELEAKIPGIDNSKFQELASNAKANCPVSKALSATPISLKAKLLD